MGGGSLRAPFRLGPRLIPSIPQLVVLSIILSLAPLYLKASTASNLEFSGSGLISIGSLTPAGIAITPGVFQVSGYMILGEGDIVSFDASAIVRDARYYWYLNLTIVDLVTGARWDYSEAYRVARAPTPEFSAPRSSVYTYNLTVDVRVVEFYEDKADYRVEVRITGSQGDRGDVRGRMLLELPILALALLALTPSYGFLERAPYRGFIGLIRWELRGLWVYAMFAIVAVSYALIIANFNSRIGRFTVLLGPVALANVPEFSVLYMVLVEVLTVILLAYKWETGHERTMDLVNASRVSRFTAKIIALITVTLIPIVLVSINTYILWIPDLPLSQPRVFAELLAAHTLYVALITIFSASIAALFSTAIPLTSIATLLSVAVTLTLYIDNPLKQLVGFDLKRLLSVGDPFMGGRPVAEILYVNLESLRLLLAPSLLLLALALLLYARRENP